MTFSMPVVYELIPGRRAVLIFLDGVPEHWKEEHIARYASGLWFQIMRIHNDRSVSGQFVTLKVDSYGKEMS